MTEKETDRTADPLEAAPEEYAPEVPVESPEEAEEEVSPEEVVEELKAELQETRARADENLDGWQRTLADFANYKKRVDRERETVYQEAYAKMVLRYLEILDDLDRALQNRPTQGEGASWAEGIALIARKLHGFLQSEGVESIEAEGQMFDPNLHEALTQEESEEHESGQVIGVVQEGYRLGNRVIRPARVRVAR